MALLLQLWGHRSAVAYTGESALEVATTFRPDVVLLDIGLPGMDGYEVAWRIRQLPGLARCRLMALTGNGQEDDVRRYKEVGIDFHFLKPVEPAILRAVLGGKAPQGARAAGLFGGLSTPPRGIAKGKARPIF
jgi:CheY-like chemotaxis protein